MTAIAASDAKKDASRLRLPLFLRHARRELRGGLRGFRVFLACLALGVATTVGQRHMYEDNWGAGSDDPLNKLVDCFMATRARRRDCWYARCARESVAGSTTPQWAIRPRALRWTSSAA